MTDDLQERPLNDTDGWIFSGVLNVGYPANTPPDLRFFLHAVNAALVRGVTLNEITDRVRAMNRIPSLAVESPPGPSPPSSLP